MGTIKRRTFIRQSVILSSFCLLPKMPFFPLYENEIPYVDGLSLWPESLSSLKEAGLSAFIADVSAGEAVMEKDGTMAYRRTYKACLESLTAKKKLLQENNSNAFLAVRGNDIETAFKEKKTAVYLQFQGGGETLDTDISRLDSFYQNGLRVFQLTHHFNNLLGGGALEKEPTGLTSLGFSAIDHMNELGIIPDISHASHLCALDVIKRSKKPVIISHSGARALVNNARCTPDEVIRKLAGSGGVMGIFMMSFWLTADPVPTVEHLIKQIRHIINVGGIDTVGISNDYPVTGEASLLGLNNDNEKGVKLYHPWWNSIKEKGITGFEELPKHVVIPELNNVKRMFLIHKALKEHNFKSSEIEKIMGGNWIRVLKESLG